MKKSRLVVTEKRKFVSRFESRLKAVWKLRTKDSDARIKTGNVSIDSPSEFLSWPIDKKTEEIKPVVLPKDLFEHGEGTELLADFEMSDYQNSEARNNLEDSSIPYSCKSSQLPIAGRNQDCNCGKKKLYLEINEFYLPSSENVVFQTSDASFKIKIFLV